MTTSTSSFVLESRSPLCDVDPRSDLPIEERALPRRPLLFEDGRSSGDGVDVDHFALCNVNADFARRNEG